MLKTSVFAAIAAILIIFSVSFSTVASTSDSDENALLEAYMSANGYGDTETDIIKHLGDAYVKSTFTRLYQFVKTQPQTNQITFALPELYVFGMGGLYVPDPLKSENLGLLQLTSTDEIKTGFPIIEKMFNADTEDCKSKSVMQMYGDTNNPFSDLFQSQILDDFNVKIVHVDYNKSTESAAIINDWVKSVTGFTSTDILPEYRINSDTGAMQLGSSSLLTYWGDDLVVKDADNSDVTGSSSTQQIIEITGPVTIGKYEKYNATVISIPLAGSCERKILMAKNDDSYFANMLYTLQDPKTFYKVVSLGETQKAQVYMPNDTYTTGKELYIVAMKLFGHLYNLFVPNANNVCNGIYEGKTDCGHLSVCMHELELSIQNKPAEASERRRRDTTEAEADEQYTTIHVTDPYASIIMCHGIPYYATLNFGTA